MAEQILDGKGRGYRAEVTADNLLETNAVTESTYAWTSRVKERAFSIASEAITTDGTNNVVFHLTNPSNTDDIVIVQIDGSCDTNALFSIDLDEAYASGGTGITPTNLNRKSARPSIATNTDAYYGDDISVTGTAKNYSRFYVLASTVYREEILNTIILGFNDTLVIRCNAPAGSAYVTVKYYEVKGE